MDHVVKKTIRIQSDPARVWDALTNPEKTKKYFFHTKVFSDWQVGGSIRFVGRIFLVKKIELSGKILALERGKLLKYNIANTGDGSGSLSTVTDVLSYGDGITTLSVTDDVGRGEGAKERFARSNKAWDKVLQGLKKVVERE